MANCIANNKDWQMEAQNDTNNWGFLGSCSDYESAAVSFKLSKSWDQAGSFYVKLAECHLKMDSTHEAAAAYVDAAHCYKKISPIQAISCLEQAVNLFSGIGRSSIAARYCKEVGGLYEQLRNFEEALIYFEQAAKLFHDEEATSASQCKEKIAQMSAQLKQYTKAIEIFEEIAREAVKSSLLRYGVRGQLLNAGICHLCSGDLVAVTSALESYKDLDPTFSRTREYQLLIDLMTTYNEKDVEGFTEVLKDYDSLSPLDSWKTILLLRVKEVLKAKNL